MKIKILFITLINFALVLGVMLLFSTYNLSKESMPMRVEKPAPRFMQTDSTSKAIDRWRIIDRDSYNNQLQYYCADNVEFHDNRIAIRVKKENHLGKGFTSGMIESNEAYLYGSFDFLVSAVKGKGLFPAIWLMPKEDKAYPEVDIFELNGTDLDRFYGVVHYKQFGIKKRDFFRYKVNTKNTYWVGLKWTREELSWYIDGECVFQTKKCVPNEPMYLIIDMSIEKEWAREIDKTQFPTSFIIEDYTIKPERTEER